MNIATLYSSLTSAIVSAQATFNIWAQAAYGKNHTYIIRFDIRDAPDPSECPCTAISPISRMANQEMKDSVNGFIFHSAVYDATTSGFANLEAYRKIVEGVIVNAISAADSSLIIPELKVEYDINTAFPFLWSGTLIQIKQYNTIGANPLS
jgi:hypothetical protein